MTIALYPQRLMHSSTRSVSTLGSHLLIRPNIGRPYSTSLQTNLYSSYNSYPPRTPRNFNSKDFSLPPYKSKLLLESKNPHPLDNSIQFNEMAHTYTVNGNLMKYSVTSLIERYFEKFDPDSIIPKMMGGSNWPREEYLNLEGEPMTAEQIKEKWESMGITARNYGSWIHHNIERYLNQMPTGKNVKEIDRFKIFQEQELDSLGVMPYRTEWRIAAPNNGIAGSVDFVGKLPDGTYMIADWKTSKALKDRLVNGYGKKALYPISHIDDCEGSKYYLQLNMYRYILQNYYGLVVSKMTLVSIHSNYDPYFCIDVPEMDEEIEKIIVDIDLSEKINMAHDSFSFENLA